ncbi:hypothetical protein DL96DRAFT_1824844 [Flagelloscypha sp. PMI_526]|nr:hypothetical protein DL96DRAFT_1824844 [Flagelloscypha sp. PMI_526]
MRSLSLGHDGIALLIGNLRSLTVSLDDGKSAQESTFALIREEALKRFKSLTSMDLGTLADASGAESIEKLERTIDQNQYAPSGTGPGH